jgi:hypothetical protein
VNAGKTDGQGMTMNFQHVNVKIFVDGDLTVEPGRFIHVFHEWIQEKKDLGVLLIDVADYTHVPAGPGVLLIGFEADYSMDHADNRWGLRYNRKAPVEGDNADRFRQAFRSAVLACRLLEERFAEERSLTFSRRRFELFLNDRALAPRTPETWAVFQAEVEAFLRQTFGANEFSLERDDDPRRRVGVTVTFARPVDWGAVTV